MIYLSLRSGNGVCVFQCVASVTHFFIEVLLLVEDIENRDFLKELFEVMYGELSEPKKRR